MPTVIHIAGFPTRVGTHMRQRCAWCGTVLIDLHLENVAVAAKEDGSPGDLPGHWETGALVAVDGGCSYIVRHEDGTKIPDGWCGDGVAAPRPKLAKPS
jgi:hypothetical protein